MNNDNQIYKIFRYETGGVYFFTLSYSGRFKKRWKLKVLATAETFNKQKNWYPNHHILSFPNQLKSTTSLL